MAINKENKRRSVATTPMPGLLMPVANSDISKADRRAVAGVYWGFLPGPAIANSGRFVDAETWFFGEDRDFLDVLPRNMIWNLDAGLEPVDRRNILNTEMYAVPVTSTGSIDPVGGIDITEDGGSGLVNLPDYIKAHDHLPITIRVIYNEIVRHYDDVPPPSNVLTVYPCWQEDGTHVGTDVDGSPSICANDPTDLFPDEELRFKDALGDRVIGTSDNGVFFLFPIIPADAIDENGATVGAAGETIQRLWAVGEERSWLSHPARNLSIVEALANDHEIYVSEDFYSPPVSPSLVHPGGAGLLADYEEFPGGYTSDSTLKQRLDEDERFDEAAPYMTAARLYQRYVGEMLDARLAKLAELADWADPLHSNLYDYSQTQAGGFTTAFTRAYNRNRMKLEVFAFGGTPGYDADEAMVLLGARVAEGNGKLPASAQIFDFWFSASLSTPSGGTGYDPAAPGSPDVGEGWLTIGESVMLLKCAMALGAIRLLFLYSFSATNAEPLHPFYSIAVAYAEMQPHADVIINGTNFIPPPDNNLFGDSPWQVTPFYRRDTSDNELTSTYICCRVYGEKTLFFGGTIDGQSRTVTVKAPNGDSVAVFATPFGEVTVVEG